MKISSCQILCLVMFLFALGCGSVAIPAGQEHEQDQEPGAASGNPQADQKLPSENSSNESLELDFSNMMALLISDNSDSLSLVQSATSSSNLKKVTESGQIEDVVISGKVELENLIIGPSKIFYGILKTKSALSTGEPSCLFFAASLDQGVPYCIDKSLTAMSRSSYITDFRNPPVQFDSSGAVYYSGTDESGRRVLRKFDGEETKDLLDENLELIDFIVLSDSTVYLLGSTPATGQQWLRKLSPQGSLSNLIPDETNTSVTYMKLFPDGNVYYGTSRGMGRILVKSHKNSTVKWISEITPTTYTEMESGSAGDYVKMFFSATDTRVFGLSKLYNSKDYGVVRFYPTPARISLTLLSHVTNAISVGNRLLLSGTGSDGKNRLVMYNQDNNQEVDLIPDEEIEIFNLAGGSDQTKIYFDGLRFSNNSFVIAEYDINSHHLSFLSKLPGKPKIFNMIKYDSAPAPSKDRSEGSWTAVAQSDAPSARSQHQSVWTGNEVFIWGGRTVAADGELQTGALYDPSAGTWRASSIVDAPTERTGFSMTWTGDKAIVFGGYNWGGSTLFLAEPKAYNPTNDTWTTLNSTNVPSARAGHSAVWTGSKIIIWGGIESGSNRLNTGAIYDPSSDTWTPMSTVSAPSGRARHTAIWTGSRMIVFGGYSNQGDLGGIYDPISDSWGPLSPVGAPSIRWHHSAVWTGTRMIVWGGVFDSSVGQNNPIYYDDGYSYDPVSDSWQVLSKSGRPPARAAHSAIWTGSAMIIFGGNSHLSLGGLYDPADDTWTAISHDNAVTYRQSHTGLWIGDRIMVWGGRAEAADAGDGGIFVP